jgi:hypothetical protein
MSGILEQRSAEMAHSPTGWFDRSEHLTVATLGDAANRLQSATVAVGQLDGQPSPAPDLVPGVAALLASKPGPCLALSARPIWTITDVLVGRLASLEGRLALLDRVSPPDAATDPVARINAEVQVQGFGSRHLERLFEAIRQLITRTIAIEARIRALASPQTTAAPAETPTPTKATK